MDQKAALDSAKKYAALVQRIVHPSKIVLFGSYATGRFHEHSDIDVAIIVESLGADFFDLSVQLNRLTTDVDKRIEPVLVSEKNDPSGFVASILQKGILLYSKAA